MKVENPCGSPARIMWKCEKVRVRGEGAYDPPYIYRNVACVSLQNARAANLVRICSIFVVIMVQIVLPFTLSRGVS